MQEYIQMTSRHWASFWKVKAFCAVYFLTYTCIYKIKYWLKGYKEEQYKIHLHYTQWKRYYFISSTY